MAKDIETPNLFNPMMLWADMGMRAVEMTLSSPPTTGDGIDRPSRTGGRKAAPVETVSQDPARALPAFPDLSLFLQMQRATFDLMTQGWQQWMNTFVTLSSFGMGHSFAETARQNPMLNAMQGLLMQAADETVRQARSRSS